MQSLQVDDDVGTSIAGGEKVIITQRCSGTRVGTRMRSSFTTVEHFGSLE